MIWIAWLQGFVLGVMLTIIGMLIAFARRRRGGAVRFHHKIGPDYRPRIGEVPVIEITIRRGRAKDETFVPVDINGKPVSLDGPATLTVISGTSAVQGSNLADGSAIPTDGLIQPFWTADDDAIGDTDFNYEGDGRQGPDIVIVQELIRVHVIPDDAATFRATESAEYDPRP